MRDRPTLLITRPEEGAARLAAAARARFGADFALLIAPLTRIVPTGAALPEADVLIFTSEQAVRFAGNGRPAYCVGARTAVAARAAGFVAIEGPGTAEGLSALILAQHPAGRIVHARGAEAALPLAQALAAAGLPAQEAIIYRQESAALSPEAAALLQGTGPVLVPVFSARGAARFAAAAAGARAPLWIAAISDAAAQPCAALHPARLEIAARPDLEGVLAAMSRCLGDLPG